QARGHLAQVVTLAQEARAVVSLARGVLHIAGGSNGTGSRNGRGRKNRERRRCPFVLPRAASGVAACGGRHRRCAVDAGRVSDAVASPPAPGSVWRPLRTPIFRRLLLADVVSDVGTFMQSVGSAWLMVSLGASAFYVALTQTASTLPFFLLALPAGSI